METTEPQAGASPEATSAAPETPSGTPCRACSAPLVEGQEWCLACGAARRPPRLHEGRRPFLATVAATIVLLGVAAAAGYAAIIDQPPVTATATAPAPLPPPTVPTTSTTTTPTTPTTPSTPPVTNPTYTPPSTPAAPYVPPATPYVPPTPSGGGGGGTTTTTKTTPTTPTVPPLTVIPASDTTPTAYDPYNQLLEPLSDPNDAVDTAKQQWSALTDPGPDPANPKLMQVGLMVSVDAKTALQQVTFLTDTPGFTVQLYGSAAKTPPPEITHGWTNLGQRTNVDGKKTKDDPKPGDGKVTIDFGHGDKFRHLLLWFTTPPPVKTPATPPAPSKVTLSKLRLYK